MTIPHLIEFLGDYRSANEDLPLLVPALAIQELQTALAETYPVQALDTDLIAPKTVLQPRQQEIYDLLRERLLMLRETLPSGVACLDVGCGSGALALVTAQLLAGQGAHVWATDKLPEALATTRLNVAKLAEEGLINAQDVTVTEGGDLYEPVADMRFGLVTFNPPWARRAPRTRLEIARFDPGQRLLRRFLAETPAHLAADGHLLLFYADNAGPEAITTLEEEADAAGLRTVERLSVRIRVSSGWEHIYLYDMVCDQPKGAGSRAFIRCHKAP
jgi:methylase of polypeptide subunit release factors